MFGCDSERTFVMLKPDATEGDRVQTDILRSLLSLSGVCLDHEYPLRQTRLTEEQVREHYGKYAEPGNEAPFFADTLEYMTRGSVILVVLHGDGCQQKVRDWAGATRPWEAKPGTIRARFGKMTPTETGSIENVVHVYDPDDGYPPEVEIERFYGKK